MKTTDRLIRASKEIWESYNKHPFVMGIQNGTLEKEKFRYYIMQDFLYLKDYTKIFAIGMAKAKSIKTASLFSKYIAVINSEMDIHRGYIGKLHITQEEIDSMKPSLDNLSYTSYMLRVAYEEGEAEILTAILSCAYTYEAFPKKTMEDRPDAVNDSFYSDWIKGYTSKAYADENVVLLNTLNELTEHYTEAQISHLVDIFVACSRYELAFWQMSWEMKP